MKAFPLLRKAPVSVKGSLILGVVLCFILVSQIVRSAYAATPVITGVAVSNVLSTSATIAWATDIASDTQIEYGLTTAYESTTTLNTAQMTSHSQNITGLQANRQYNFQVKSRDSFGNLATSGNRTFTTASGATTPGTNVDSDNSNTMNATRFTTVDGGKLASLSAHVGAVDSTVTNRSTTAP